MLVDANILLYSVDEDSPFHAPARDWMVASLNGAQQVGIPWMSFWAFIRIVTNPRALTRRRPGYPCPIEAIGKSSAICWCSTTYELGSLPMP
jgi:predicted nucleic acid-binding protein